MKFEEAPDPHYARWLVSKSGAFFIGVADYLFGQKCIQVQFAGSGETGHRWVIQEWRTYKAELVEKLIQEIQGNLANVEASWGDWGLVEKFLPEKRAEYLEEVINETQTL